MERKFTKIPKFKTSYITSFVFGIAFAAGWTPCVGPILGSTFTLAATNPGTAYNLLISIFIRFRNSVLNYRGVLFTSYRSNQEADKTFEIFQSHNGEYSNSNRTIDIFQSIDTFH